MVQWFRTVLSMQKAQIQYLVWELRSPDAAQHRKKKKKKATVFFIFGFQKFNYDVS